MAAPRLGLAATVFVVLAAVARAQDATPPQCPLGTVLVWKVEDYDITDPSATRVASATCVTGSSAVLLEASSSGGSTDTLGGDAAAPAPADAAPAPASGEAPGCPDGTVAVTTYQDVDITDPSAQPIVTVSCLPIKVRPTGHGPLVTATLDGTLDLTPVAEPPPALAPCAEGLVRLTPAAAKCTPW